MARTLGELDPGERGFDLGFERILAVDVAEAWSAVTAPERLVRWMATYSGEFRTGGEWVALGSGGEVYTRGRVLECEPRHRFATTWQHLEEPESLVTVTIDPHPEGARLRLRHQHLRDVTYGPGWQTYLEQLDDLLGAAASSVVDPDRTPGVEWQDRFAALQPLWRERFTGLGIEG